MRWYDLIKLLLQGEDVFVDVNRKMAYYVKRRVNETLEALGLKGYLVEAYPSIFNVDGKDVDGYTFRLVRWRGGEDKVFLEKRGIIGRIKELLERAEGELKMLEQQPPDRTLTTAKKQLKARIETLKEVIRLIESL